MNRELVTGLAQLSAEKGLPKEVVSDIIARAIKRAYGDDGARPRGDGDPAALRAGSARTVLRGAGAQGRGARGPSDASRTADHREPRAQGAREAALRARGAGDLSRPGRDRRDRSRARL